MRREEAKESQGSAGRTEARARRRRGGRAAGGVRYRDGVTRPRDRRGRAEWNAGADVGAFEAQRRARGRAEGGRGRGSGWPSAGARRGAASARRRDWTRDESNRVRDGTSGKRNGETERGKEEERTASRRARSRLRSATPRRRGAVRGGGDQGEKAEQERGGWGGERGVGGRADGEIGSDETNKWRRCEKKTMKKKGRNRNRGNVLRRSARMQRKTGRGVSS